MGVIKINSTQDSFGSNYLSALSFSCKFWSGANLFLINILNEK